MTASSGLWLSAASSAVVRLADFAAFASGVRQQVAIAAAAGSQLVTFPEYFTSPLLGIDPRWEAWTEPYETLLRGLSREFGLAILGTHLHRDPGGLYNRATIVVPDGRSVCQDKVHLTPWERQAGLASGSGLTVVEMLGTRLAVLICYDVEFPALAAAAAAAGVEVLLVPSWTDDRQGFFRVRHCAQARTVEQQLYVVHAPLVGGAATIPEFEQACGRPGILSPCDIGFPEAGIVADGVWDEPQVVSAWIDLGLLRRVHASGTVTPRRDARAAADCQVTQVVTL